MDVRTDYFVVRKSSIHHMGAFAVRDIPKGTRIIEYVGEKISKEEGDRRSEAHISRAENDSHFGSVYVFELDDKHDIDGSVDYNAAKYINHSCNPNCEVDTVGGHIWIVAIRDIREGEELTYNYSYDMEDFEDYPCHCGHDECPGFILDNDYWPKVREILKGGGG